MLHSNRQKRTATAVKLLPNKFHATANVSLLTKLPTAALNIFQLQLYFNYVFLCAVKKKPSEKMRDYNRMKVKDHKGD